jgi:hypothetical protein
MDIILAVLRTSERARNIHALCSVRDQTDNQMARVNAVKALEQLEDQAPAGNSLQRSPGLQIVIVQPPATVASAIDVTPSRSSD